jgi:hypothetical protein
MQYLSEHDLFRAEGIAFAIESDTIDWETGTAVFEIAFFQADHLGLEQEAQND